MKKNSYLKPDLQVIKIETEQIMTNSPGLGGPSNGDQEGNIPANTNYNNTWNSQFEEE